MTSENLKVIWFAATLSQCDLNSNGAEVIICSSKPWLKKTRSILYCLKVYASITVYNNRVTNY